MPNPPFVALSTLAQIRTELRELSLGSTMNVNVITSVNARFAQSARPSTIAAGGAICINSEGMSYMKMMPFMSNSGGNTVTSPVIRVVGWNFMASQNLYIPQMLAEITTTLSAQPITINGATVFQPLTFTKTLGDAKTFNSNATHVNGACFLIDTLGCSIVEVLFRATSVSGTPIANLAYSSL